MLVVEPSFPREKRKTLNTVNKLPVLSAEGFLSTTLKPISIGELFSKKCDKKTFIFDCTNILKTITEMTNTKRGVRVVDILPINITRQDCVNFVSLETIRQQTFKCSLQYILVEVKQWPIRLMHLEKNY